MVDPTQLQYAMKRLRTDSDFQLFIESCEDRLAEKDKSLREIDSEIRYRREQGAAMELVELIYAMKGT